MIKGCFKRKKYIYILFLFVMMFIFGNNNSFAYTQSTISDTFPASYQSYIDKLKKEHPNWTIKAFYTHLDWTTVLNSEASGTYSRIQNSAYGDAWKRLESADSSSYNAAGFVLASRSAVAYVLDPRNSLNDQGIFQFRVIDANIDSDTEAAVNAVAYNTPMYDTTYASIIQKVGQEKTIAPTFIISRIRQETSCDIVNNGSINGKNSKYPNYYNFFNIGAVDGSGAVQAGINLAYSMGWNTPEKAIAGGMDWLNKKYVKYGQNTVYFQKFDVANPYGNAVVMLCSQYMTNIMAPMGEAKITYNGLSRAGTLDNAYTFYIPIYDNMPSVAAAVPTTGYYENDNTMVYLDDPSDSLADTFKIRSSADSSNSSNVVYTLVEPSDVSKKTILTRLKKGIDTGWDYVQFEVNGKTIEGYVWNSYVYEYSYTKVTGVSLDIKSKTLKVGDSSSLVATVAPTNAKYKDVEWSSSNSNIVTVDSNGRIKAVAAGSAIVTVKTKDQAKTAECVVTVTDKEPSITLNKAEYTVIKDKSVLFTTTISDTDIKEYDVAIEDESIAKIEDSKIIGLAEGETKITVTLKGTEIKSEATIKVIDLKDEDIIIDECLNVNEDIISKIDPETKVQDIKEKIQTVHNMIIKNSNNVDLSDESLIGTGSKVQIVDSNNEVLYEYNVVIYGDVNGDGKITSKDYMMIRNHIMEISALSGVSAEAADTFVDNNITSKDYMMIRNHIMETSFIEQR